MCNPSVLLYSKIVCKEKNYHSITNSKTVPYPSLGKYSKEYSLQIFRISEFNYALYNIRGDENKDKKYKKILYLGMMTIYVRNNSWKIT